MPQNCPALSTVQNLKCFVSSTSAQELQRHKEQVAGHSSSSIQLNLPYFKRVSCLTVWGVLPQPLLLLGDHPRTS